MTEQKLTPKIFLRNICAIAIMKGGLYSQTIKNISIITENHSLIESLLNEYAKCLLEENEKDSLEYTNKDYNF